MDIIKIVSDTLEKYTARDVVVIPTHNKTDLFQYLIVATVANPVHMRHIAHEILGRVRETPSHEEPGDEWYLIDLQSVVVNIFSAEARTRFDLEGLWSGDASQRIPGNTDC